MTMRNLNAGGPACADQDSYTWPSLEMGQQIRQTTRWPLPYRAMRVLSMIGKKTTRKAFARLAGCSPIRARVGAVASAHPGYVALTCRMRR